MDAGRETYEWGRSSKGFDDSGKRGHYWLQYLQSIITDPRKPANIVCSRVVNTLDLYKPLVELCGLPPRNNLDGVSLVTLLDDPYRTWDFPSISVRSSRNLRQFSTRNEQWRYTNYDNTDEELYNHADDPHECQNLAQDSAYDIIKVQLATHFPQKTILPIGELEKNPDLSE